MSVFQSDELENRLQELEGLLRNPNLDEASIENLHQEQESITKLLESGRDKARSLDNLYDTGIAELMQAAEDVQANEAILSSQSEEVMDSLEDCSSAQVIAAEMLNKFYEDLDTEIDEENLTKLSQEAKNVYDPDYVNAIFKQYAAEHPVKYFVSSMIDALHKTIAEISEAKKDVYEAALDYEETKNSGYGAITMAMKNKDTGLSASLFHVTRETVFSGIHAQFQRLKSVFTDFPTAKEKILSATKETLSAVGFGLATAAEVVTLGGVSRIGENYHKFWTRVYDRNKRMNESMISFLDTHFPDKKWAVQWKENLRSGIDDLESKQIRELEGYAKFCTLESETWKDGVSPANKVDAAIKQGVQRAEQAVVNSKLLTFIQRQVLTGVAFLYNHVSNFHTNALSAKATAISTIERMTNDRINQYQKIQKNLENSTQKISDAIQELMLVPMPVAAEYATSEQGKIFASQIEAIEQVVPEGSTKKQMLADIEKQMARDKKAFDRTEAKAVDAEAKAVSNELERLLKDFDRIPELQEKAQKRVDVLSAIAKYLDAKHDKTMEQMEKSSSKTLHVIPNAPKSFQNKGSHLEAAREDLALE